MADEFIIEKIPLLSQHEHRSSTLLEIREYFNNLSIDEISNQCDLALSTLHKLADELREDDRMMNELLETFTVFRLRCVQTDIGFTTYCTQLLNHCFMTDDGNEKKKGFGLNEISKIFCENPNITGRWTDERFPIEVIKCLQNESLQLKSTDVLIKLLIFIPSTRMDSIIMAFDKAIKTTDDIKCSCYEAAIKASVHSEEVLQKMSFIFEYIQKDLNTDDFLLQFNVLDIISELPATDHGFAYFQQQKLFNIIFEQLKNSLIQPINNTLVPTGHMYFIGNIAHTRPLQILTECSSIINIIFDCVKENGDEALIFVALETIGVFVRNNDMKIFLNTNYQPQLKELFIQIQKIITNIGKTEQVAKALNGLEVIFQKEWDKPRNNRISSITETWYKYLTNTSTNLSFISKYCLNPFPSIKVPALKLLTAICEYRWGQMALANTAGFIEYLLDRKSEFDKYVLYEKYNVIKMLNKEQPMVFSGQIGMDIQKYFNDGIFFVPTVMEVTTEGNP